MGYSVIPECWATCGKALTLAEKVVLQAIAAHAGKDGKAWPSIPRLVDGSGVSRAGVFAAILGLETKGAVKVDRTVGRSTTYWIQETRPAIGPVQRLDPSTVWTKPVQRLDSPVHCVDSPVQPLDPKYPKKDPKKDPKEEPHSAPQAALGLVEYKPKPHTLSEKQQRAIERKAKALIVAKAWNEILAPPQPPIERTSGKDWDNKVSPVLAKALDWLEDEHRVLRPMLDFCKSDDYLSGRDGRFIRVAEVFFSERFLRTTYQRYENSLPPEPYRPPPTPKPTPTICPVCHRERPQGEKVTDDWGCLACLGDPDGPDQTLVQETDDETP